MSLLKEKKFKGIDTAFFYFMLLAGALIGAVLFIANADTMPATYDDYSPLYEQVDCLKRDFSSIGEMDNVKFYNNDKGKLDLDGGKECDLAVYFDNNKQITATSEIDKSLTGLQFIAYLLISALVGAGVGAVITTGFFSISIIVEKKQAKRKS